MEAIAAVKILQDLIALETVNGQESLVADYLAQLFADYPVQIKRINYAPGRDNLVVEIGDQGPILGFSGHEDVVAAGNRKMWQTDPFQGVVRAGKVYGRGASDMKSGLAAMVVAMLDLLEEDQPLPGRIRLLASVGEETGEYGAAQLTQTGYAADLAGLVIGEPTGMRVRVTHKGIIDYYVTSTGRSAHSSCPQRGENAIWPLIQFAQQIQTIMDQHQEQDPTLGGLTHVISQIQGGEQINSIPAQAQIGGNIRTTPVYPNEMIMKEIEAVVEKLNQAGAHLKLRYSYPEPPLPDQRKTKLAQLASKVLREQFQQTGEFCADTGATDASEYIKAGKFPIIIVGPGMGETSHQPDECVSIADYLEASKFYRALAWAFWQQ
ncbi:ArgE/DapE family deacylase [Lactobacillus sp. DCY120]|uniref:Probable succinyl-diaminopimelate desuccinylase n=1 Tax=Bombilactobacillus apium TaxID=2675299 RepID=A0A850R223_9LACO|nr:ArgE/DapE family deacylase [Bombilactobacillus apium]NVY96071.1 ArgE/DapE family deacylase [Bombilactobacillus apium]